MDEPTVSVILGTYNGERFLDKQLASIGSQTLRPYELLAADDLSTDGTIEILERFKASAGFPVKVFRNRERLGSTKNFMQLAAMASGRYVAFCDQDDTWRQDRLKVCADALVEYNAKMVSHPLILIDEHDRVIGKWNQAIKTQKNKMRRNDPWSNFLGMSIVFERSLLNAFKADEYSRIMNPHFGIPGMSHDQWIDFLADAYSGIYIVKEPLSSYRLHGGNESGADKGLAARTVQIKIAAGFAATPERKLSFGAAQRSVILEQVATGAVGLDKANLNLASLRWKKIADIERKREDLYNSGHIGERLAKFGSLFSSGCYLPGYRGGVGWLLFLKDAVLGVMKRP